MARTVLDGFDVLVGRIKPTETETVSAASHRASIEACLKSNFGMTSFFRAGSFGHGTSVSGYSDIDYFAVVPSENLKNDSAAALREFRVALENRFPATGVFVHSPTVVLPFGTTQSERHEVTPAYFIERKDDFNVYGMPDRMGGWMKSSPKGHNSFTNSEATRLGPKAKNLIRLVKLWNYEANAGVRSIYIELRVVEYLKNETTVSYAIDVKRALKHMHSKGLAAMQDPLSLTGYVYPCSDAVKPDALSKLSTAVTRAEKALAADSDGKTIDAFYWWDLVFFAKFPAYY